MKQISNNLKTIQNKIVFLLFVILPIGLIVGSAVSNSIILLINLLFIIEILKKKNLPFLIDRWFYILLLLWLCLLANSILIANNSESLIRSFGFFRFILLVFAFKYFMEQDKGSFKNAIMGSWFIIFNIVTIDIFFEFFNGSNILGFSSEFNGRIASFTGDELKIGNYYFGFILLSLCFFYKNFYKKYQLFFYILLLIFLVSSFFIGERSNFIKVFLICITFIFLINNQNYLKKFLIIVLFFIISIITISNNEFFKGRILKEVIEPIKQDGISKFIDNSKYGKHYLLAKKIYLENKIFGVGIKNYRIASRLPKYNSNENLDGSTTHPHQIHYEFLSETGTVGYIIFITFFLYSIIIGFINFFKNNNPYVLSSTLFLIATALPFIPSGSFFTSYGATIFWINFSFLLIKK